MGQVLFEVLSHLTLYNSILQIRKQRPREVK